MLASDNSLKALHKKSIRNEEEILRYKNCCCFSCLKSYDASEISFWADEPDGQQRTAFCPFCSVDSVLANDPNNPFPEDLLKAMEAKYFGIQDKFKR